MKQAKAPTPNRTFFRPSQYLSNLYCTHQSYILDSVNMPQDSFDDYYEVLQVSPNAQPETVQRVYRLLAQLYHPDNKDTGNKETFEHVLQAYRVSTIPEKRAAYDVEHRVATGQVEDFRSA